MTDTTPDTAAKTEQASGNGAGKTAAADAAAAARAPKDRKYAMPAGYINRWPHGGYDLLKKTDPEVKGPDWQVTCNVHGKMTAATGTKDGDSKGSKAGRALWCPGCKADAARAARAAR